MNVDTFFTGDALEVLKGFPDNMLDSLVCDPPAGINFMGLSFDSHKGGRQQWIAWLALMRYLVRLITPPDGIVLDCFAGSGTTCEAAYREGFHFIGIEKDSHYSDLAQRRIIWMKETVV